MSADYMHFSTAGARAGESSRHSRRARTHSSLFLTLSLRTKRPYTVCTARLESCPPAGAGDSFLLSLPAASPGSQEKSQRVPGSAFPDEGLKDTTTARRCRHEEKPAHLCSALTKPASIQDSQGTGLFTPSKTRHLRNTVCQEPRDRKTAEAVSCKVLRPPHCTFPSLSSWQHAC